LSLAPLFGRRSGILPVDMLTSLCRRTRFVSGPLDQPTGSSPSCRSRESEISGTRSQEVKSAKAVRQCQKMPSGASSGARTWPAFRSICQHDDRIEPAVVDRRERRLETVGVVNLDRRLQRRIQGGGPRLLLEIEHDEIGRIPDDGDGWLAASARGVARTVQPDRSAIRWERKRQSGALARLPRTRERVARAVRERPPSSRISPVSPGPSPGRPASRHRSSPRST
jgi:hypothetical protein